MPERNHPLGAADPEPANWQEVLRWTAVATLAGSASIHASVTAEHFEEWFAEGAFFLLLQVVEMVLALAIAGRRATRNTYKAAIVASIATIAVWAVSRTVGMPIGPDAWTAEPVGRSDAISTLLELMTAAVLVPLVAPRPGRLAITALMVGLFVGTSGATAFALQTGEAEPHGHGDGDGDGERVDPR